MLLRMLEIGFPMTKLSKFAERHAPEPTQMLPPSVVVCSNLLSLNPISPGWLWVSSLLQAACCMLVRPSRLPCLEHALSCGHLL